MSTCTSQFRGRPGLGKVHFVYKEDEGRIECNLGIIDMRSVQIWNFHLTFHAFFGCLAKIASVVQHWVFLAENPTSFIEQLLEQGCTSFITGIGATLFPFSAEHLPSGITQFLKISLGGGGCHQYFSRRTGVGLFLSPWD